jgi:hypothetical protein
MPRSAVNARYKDVSYSSCAAGDCSATHTNTATYFKGHGAVYVHFDAHDLVDWIVTKSPYYRTNEDVGPASTCSGQADEHRTSVRNARAGLSPNAGPSTLLSG